MDKHLEAAAREIYDKTAMTTQSWDCVSEAVKNVFREDAWKAQAAALAEARGKVAELEESARHWKQRWYDETQNVWNLEARLTLVEDAARHAEKALRVGGLFPIKGVAWQKLHDALPQADGAPQVAEHKETE